MATLEGILDYEIVWGLGMPGVRLRIRLETGTNSERRARWEKGRIARMKYMAMGLDDGVDGGKWNRS